ncbi:hypothetical protein ILUMI_16223, partial [Ignelater luminosus]
LLSAEMSNRLYETPKTVPEVALDSSFSDVIGLQTLAVIAGPSYGDDKVTPGQIRPFPTAPPRKGPKHEEKTGNCHITMDTPQKKSLK